MRVAAAFMAVAALAFTVSGILYLCDKETLAGMLNLAAAAANVFGAVMIWE